MSHNQPNQTFYLDQSTLQCKNQCGFFGNPEWLGYCSICFKQLNAYTHQNHSPHQQQQMQYYQQQQLLQQQQQQHMIQQHYLQLQKEHQRQHQEQQRLYFFPDQRQREELDRKQRDQLRQDILALKKPFQRKNYPESPSKSSNTSAASNETLNNLNCDQKGSTSTLAPHDNDSVSQSGVGAGGSNSGVSTSNASNLFGNLTSPTSLVQFGCDTLSNLHNTILNTAKSSFRSSPTSVKTGGASLDASSIDETSSINSTSQSEYQIGRRIGRGPWASIISPSSRKTSLADTNVSFHYDMAWVDCLNQTNRFAREFLAAEKRQDKSINDLSDMVHDFYQKMNHRFETQVIYKGATQDQLELLNDNMEMILNESIYHVVSTRIINEDEDHNMAIQKRIRSLNWITVEHLEIEIDFQRPTVHDLLDKAICQMVEMNSRTSSIDKLECIVQCSKTIFELLQDGQPSNHIDSRSNSDCGVDDGDGLKEMRSGSDEQNKILSSGEDDRQRKPRRKHIPASADQFLPVLVFVVIQANPPMLPADMKYLTRFSNPRRLMSGETGYYFTNLCCALEFIEKASGASLNISEEDFNRYISGEAIPETKSQFNTYLCDGLRTMCANDAALKKIKKQQEDRYLKMTKLSEQIDVYLETNRAKQEETKKFALTLGEKLKPNLPEFFEQIKRSDAQKANRLLPSRFRSTIGSLNEQVP